MAIGMGIKWILLCLNIIATAGIVYVASKIFIDSGTSTWTEFIWALYYL